MARGAGYGALEPYRAITLHHDRASQLRGDLEAEGPRLAGRDVVVAVRRGPIALVEDVLDIELRLPGRVDLRIDAGVEAQEARQVDAVVGRRVRIREVDGAERGRPDRIDLILVPPRELMERNELNAVALADGGRHPRIRVGVAEPGLPAVVDVTLELGLEAANSVLARQDEKARVVRIGQRNVGADQIVDRGGIYEPRLGVPFHADFPLHELLRLEDDAAVGERAELVAGGRQIRDHVGIIDRQIVHRLEDHGGRRRHPLVDAGGARSRYLIPAPSRRTD